jgi:hypothetical protein
MAIPLPHPISSTFIPFYNFYSNPSIVGIKSDINVFLSFDSDISDISY